MKFGIKVTGYSGVSAFYVGNDSIIWDSNQYQPDLLEISIISSSVNMDKDYSSDNFNFTINDKSGNYRNIFNTYDLGGAKVECRYEDPTDSTASLLSAVFTIERYSLFENIINVFCSNQYLGLYNTLYPSDTLDNGRFQDLPKENEGRLIPFTVGQFRDNSSDFTNPLKNSLKCWRYTNTSPYKYMVGITGNTITKEYVEDPNGTDRTSVFTLSSETISGNTYRYLSSTQQYDYVLLAFNSVDTDDMEELIDDIGFGLFPNDINIYYSELNNIWDYGKRAYDRLLQPFPGDELQAIDRYPLLTDKTGLEIIKDICISFELEYLINYTTDAVLTYETEINLYYSKIGEYEDITPTSYQKREIEIITGPEYSDADLINQVKYYGGYETSDQTFTTELVANDLNAQDDAGIIYSENINQIWRTNFREYDTRPWYYNAFTTAKYRMIDRSINYVTLVAVINIKDGLTHSIFDYISFKNEGAIDEGENVRWYQIRGIDHDIERNRTQLLLRDVNEFRDYIRSTLLIHGWEEDGSQNFFNWSVTGNTSIVASSTTGPKYDDSNTLFSQNTILFNGSSDYLKELNAGNTTKFYDHWDIMQLTDFTAGAWIYIDSSVSANGYIYSLYENSSNYWALYYDNANTRFRFIIVTGGVTRVDISTANASATTSTWHFVNIAKVGTDFGIYLGGDQKAYATSSNTDTIQGGFYMGTYDTTTGFWYGSQIEHITSSDNCFDLAPVVGNTDSFTLPTKEFGHIGVRG